MMLMIDRCIFSNKFSVGDFYKVFQEVYSTMPSKDKGNEDALGEKKMGREQMVYLFNLVGKKLYYPDPNYQERFYSTFLSEMTLV